MGVDVARVGRVSRPSPGVSSMILSRDARELRCVRERVRGRRRVSTVGEESGDVCGRGGATSKFSLIDRA